MIIIILSSLKVYALAPSSIYSVSERTSSIFSSDDEVFSERLSPEKKLLLRQSRQNLNQFRSDFGYVISGLNEGAKWKSNKLKINVSHNDPQYVEVMDMIWANLEIHFGYHKGINQVMKKTIYTHNKKTQYHLVFGFSPALEQYSLSAEVLGKMMKRLIFIMNLLKDKSVDQRLIYLAAINQFDQSFLKASKNWVPFMAKTAIENKYTWEIEDGDIEGAYWNGTLEKKDNRYLWMVDSYPHVEVKEGVYVEGEEHGFISKKIKEKIKNQKQRRATPFELSVQINEQGVIEIFDTQVKLSEESKKQLELDFKKMVEEKAIELDWTKRKEIVFAFEIENNHLVLNQVWYAFSDEEGLNDIKEAIIEKTNLEKFKDWSISFINQRKMMPIALVDRTSAEWFEDIHAGRQKQFIYKLATYNEERAVYEVPFTEKSYYLETGLPLEIDITDFVLKFKDQEEQTISQYLERYHALVKELEDPEQYMDPLRATLETVFDSTENEMSIEVLDDGPWLKLGLFKEDKYLMNYFLTLDPLIVSEIRKSGFKTKFKKGKSEERVIYYYYMSLSDVKEICTKCESEFESWKQDKQSEEDVIKMLDSEVDSLYDGESPVYIIFNTKKVLISELPKIDDVRMIPFLMKLPGFDDFGLDKHKINVKDIDGAYYVTLKGEQLSLGQFETAIYS